MTKKEKKKISDHNYYIKNKEKIRAKQKIWCKVNSKKAVAKSKIWHKENRERANATARLRYKINPEKYKKIIKIWASNNLNYRNAYMKCKRQSDINFRIAHNLRSRGSFAFKNQTKTGSAVRDLGCTILELTAYLEARFYANMTKENYGLVWHIDHIIPLDNFDLTDPEQVIKACHYTNLQPLLVIDNLRKSNKII